MPALRVRTGTGTFNCSAISCCGSSVNIRRFKIAFYAPRNADLSLVAWRARNLFVKRHGIGALIQSRCRSKIRLYSEQRGVPEEIKPSSAIHLAFDKLQLRDLTLCLAVRPWPGQGGSDRVQVGFDALSERGKQAITGVGQPGCQRVSIARSQHTVKAIHQIACHPKSGHPAFNHGHRDGICLGQVVTPRRQQAVQLSCRRRGARQGLPDLVGASSPGCPFCDDPNTASEPHSAKSAPQFGAIAATAVPLGC